MILLNYWMVGGAALDTWMGTFLLLAAVFALLNILQTDETGDGPHPPRPPQASAQAHEAGELQRLTEHHAQSLQMLLPPEHRT